MSPLGFSNSGIKARLFVRRSDFNCVCCVLDQFLTPKLLTQKARKGSNCCCPCCACRAAMAKGSKARNYGFRIKDIFTPRNFRNSNFIPCGRMIRMPFKILKNFLYILVLRKLLAN
ncbi:unnamed protein product [Musa textilis]